ncbi:hypothetical protein F5877DRAFT_86950 [Lentinula edodes]|nr:hypothetical protein F5877DRAFT_86950 [Lentinula edodes]
MTRKSSSEALMVGSQHTNIHCPGSNYPGDMAMRSPQLQSGTSPTVHALAHNLTPPPKVNLQTKPGMPVSTQQYQFSELGWSPALYTFLQD